MDSSSDRSKGSIRRMWSEMLRVTSSETPMAQRNSSKSMGWSSSPRTYPMGEGNLPSSLTPRKDPDATNLHLPSIDSGLSAENAAGQAWTSSKNTRAPSGIQYPDSCARS